MERSPEMRKPALPWRAGTGSMSISLAAIDVSDLSEKLLDRQAARLLKRWPLSMPTARTMAELCFGSEVRP